MRIYDKNLYVVIEKIDNETLEISFEIYGVFEYSQRHAAYEACRRVAKDTEYKNLPMVVYGDELQDIPKENLIDKTN